MPKHPHFSEQTTNAQIPGAQTAAGPDRAPQAAGPLAAPELPPSRLVFTFGRGTRGKSFWARWAIDRALNAGRDIAIGDFDRQNQSLRGFFGDARCTVPAGAEDSDIEECLQDLAEVAIAQPTNGIIDFGAGDTTLRRASRKIGGLADFLEGSGVGCTAVHVFGPSLDDLAVLRELEPAPKSRDALEQKGVFAPRCTILVLNEALVPPGSSPERIYKPLLEHPVFQAAVERGAIPAFMPRLDVAREIELKHLGFIAAEAGQPGPDGTRIGPWNRSLIRTWRQTMEKIHQDVLGWLP